MDYRTVIEKAPWGYAVHRMILDPGGIPREYFVQEINPAFEKLTGISRNDLREKSSREVFSEIFGKSFNTGEFLSRSYGSGEEGHKELYSDLLKKWFRLQGYSTGPESLVTVLTDITSEKSRTQNLDGFFAVNLDLLCIANLQGEFLLTNPAWEDVLGFTVEELRNQKFLDLVHPDDMEATLAAISHLTEQQDVLNFINRYRTKSGTYRYIEWRSHPMGSLIYAAARDVTDRMEMEQKLADSHSYTKTLLEALPDMLFVFDQNDRFVDFKSGNTQKLVMPPSAFLGKTADEILPPVVSDPLSLGLKAVRKTHEPYTFEYEIPLQEGHGHFECRLVPFPPGKIMGLVRDMTETIHAREEAQESAATLNRFFEQSTAGFFFMMLDEPVFWNDSVDKKAVMDWVFDHQRMTRINQAMLDQYQSEEKDFLGLTPRDLLGHDLEAGKKIWTEFFDQGRLHVETDERRRNGDPLAVLGDYICLYDDQGRITGHFGIQIDITSQKTLEAQLSHSRDESRDLAERATKASKAKSEFLANMSHEIRTPLNGVIGFSELLLKTPLSPLQQNYGESIATCARSLLGVINDILDFSKIEAGKLEISPVLTDLWEHLEQTMVLLRFQADQKGLELLLDIQPEMPRFVRVDPLRLRQVLVNLLGNAVKFTPQGEVELKVGFQARDNFQGCFSFSVRDTGIGIPEAQMSTLFQAFSQGDATTTRQYGGTGLGLAISSSLTRQMGSPLEVESTPGKGSLFRFSLVATWQEEEKFLPLQTLSTILVVDDNTRNRTILRHQLEHWGLKVAEAPGGKEALEYFKNHTGVDGIILDYHMPEMNGLETLTLLRAEEGAKAPTPVILLYSSGDDGAILEQAASLGVSARLSKPATSEELLKALLVLGNFSFQTWKPSSSQQEVQPRLFKPSPLILLADDIRLNITLLKSFILHIIPDAQILEACNGREVLKVLEDHTPALIFMDVQMPEMDGLEATKSIKHHLDSRVRSIPTVALTAGALEEEKQRCLEAGMEDYLSKPIDSQGLKNLLIRYLSL